MARPNPQDPLDEVVGRIDFPHLRNKNGAWLKTGPAPALHPGASFDRLCYYAEKLRELGMSDGNIACIFSDLYWDAFAECDLNSKLSVKKSEQ